jgi:hypothetical protein
VSHFLIQHDFDTDVPTFWRLFFHEPFNVAVYERIGIKERTKLEWKEDEKGIFFSVRIIPKRELPGFIKKFVSGDFGYVESSTYHRAANTLDVKIVPTMMSERVKISGLFTVKELAPGKVRRTFEGEVGVSIPLLGGKIESYIVDDTKKGYDTAAQVMVEWLKKGGF